jgi:hypothetical protein
MAQTDDDIPVDKFIAWISVRLNLEKSLWNKQAVEYRVNITTGTWMLMLSFSAPYDRTK